ncbi:MAG: C25 family cysteine peptidase [Pirellulales bacterium]
MQAALLSLLLSPGANSAPDTLVICPPSFTPALRPWVAHRQTQGHRIRFLPNHVSPYSIRDAIRAAHQSEELKYVLLIGDALPSGCGNTLDRQRTTPTYQAPARVVIQWGPEADIATDNWYADLDEDQLPDIAIGRLTADSVEELRVMVDKILAYEQRASSGPWRRRVNFVAGVGDFGPVLDTVIEAATRTFLTEGIPPSYATSMTYGSWRSPYCPDPRRFHHVALTRFNEGCLFWVYIGHGQRTFLDRVRVAGATYPILSTEDVGKLRRDGGAPIAIFLSCYSGAYDGRRDCLGEELIRAPQGPVAVLAGSRVTMPYAMAVLGNELMHEYFVSRRETLGQLILHAKRRMASTPPEESQTEISTRQRLDALATMFSPQPDRLEEERLEHVQLFNLLGDPLLRLHHANEVHLEAVEYVHAGERLHVTGSTSTAGHMTLELVCRRDQTRETPPLRTSCPESDPALEAFSRVYELANDRRWTATGFPCQEGPFEAELRVPVDARGPCYVRAFVDGLAGYALGARPVLVKSPRRLQRLAEKNRPEANKPMPGLSR